MLMPFPVTRFLLLPAGRQSAQASTSSSSRQQYRHRQGSSGNQLEKHAVGLRCGVLLDVQGAVCCKSCGLKGRDFCGGGSLHGSGTAMLSIAVPLHGVVHHVVLQLPCEPI